MTARCENCRHHQQGYCMAPVPVWVTALLAERGESRLDACRAAACMAPNCDAYHARRGAWVPPVRSLP